MSTQVRFDFLCGLERLAALQTPEDWIAVKRRYVLSSIRTPCLADIAPIVAALCHFPDAMDLLRTTCVHVPGYYVLVDKLN